MTSTSSPIVTARRPGWVPETLSFDTVPQMFWQRVDELGSAVMMRQKDLGLWRAYSWTEVGTTVAEIGAGLVSLGLEPGQVVSVLANTCREWVWADLATLSMGGICNGIYPTDAASQVEYLCVDSGSVFLFAEDDEQLDKYLEMQDRLPAIKRVIVFNMEGLQRLDDPRVISLDTLRALGRDHLKRHPSLVAERLASRKPQDVAVLVYTSGTTGRPKGAMITHANICAALAGTVNALF